MPYLHGTDCFAVPLQSLNTMLLEDRDSLAAALPELLHGHSLLAVV